MMAKETAEETVRWLGEVCKALQHSPLTVRGTDDKKRRQANTTDVLTFTSVHELRTDPSAVASKVARNVLQSCGGVARDTGGGCLDETTQPGKNTTAATVDMTGVRLIYSNANCGASGGGGGGDGTVVAVSVPLIVQPPVRYINTV